MKLTITDKLFVVVKSITVFFFYSDRQEMTKEKMFRSLFLLPVFPLLFTVFITGAQGKPPSDNAVDELFLPVNVGYSIFPGRSNCYCSV